MYVRNNVDPLSVQLLILWLQHGNLTNTGKKRTLEEISNILLVSRHVLSRFLARKFNETEERNRAADFAEALKYVVKEERPHPTVIKHILDGIYEDAYSDKGRSKDQIVSTRVLRHLAMPKTHENRRVLEQVTGYSLIIRPLETPIKVQGEWENAYSVSILTVMRKSEQEGIHHPVFTLEQSGRESKRTTIEGVVVIQEDRIILDGIDNISYKPFRSIMSIDASWQEHSAVNEASTIHNGIMLGLTSDRGTFASRFSLIKDDFELEDLQVNGLPSIFPTKDFFDLLTRLKIHLGGGELQRSIELMSDGHSSIGIIQT